MTGFGGNHGCTMAERRGVYRIRANLPDNPRAAYKVPDKDEMIQQRFTLNKPVAVEETRHYELKEVKGRNPVAAIKNTVDEYVVAFLNSEGGSILFGIRNEDRLVVGVRLTYEVRDNLKKDVIVRLMQIQPPIAPSAYRIVLHEVYEDENSLNVILDLFVVEVIVPRAFTQELFFTGGNEAFVKTDAGKKKLTGPEQYDEIRRRLISHAERRLAGQKGFATNELEFATRKKWRGLEQCLAPASIASEQSIIGYGTELAICLHETFCKTGYEQFNGMLRFDEMRVSDQPYRIYNLVCHQIGFCAVVNQRETTTMETVATIKESGLDAKGRNWEKAREAMVREVEAFEREWNIAINLVVSEKFLPVEFVYDPVTKRISVTTLRILSGNPDDYSNKVTTTSEVLHYIAAMANGRIGVFDDFFDPAKQNYPLLKLVFAASKAEFDLNSLRINVDDYEEWDYLNPAFNDKLLTRKDK
ncbi:MAG: divergent domain protein [Acidobacteria bacterium]|nr:divergent domain protein [Acidobacteriota bacterium]